MNELFVVKIIVHHRLLEYNVCLQLGIDNQSKVRERLSRIASWKQFQDNYQEEKEKKKS